MGSSESSQRLPEEPEFAGFSDHSLETAADDAGEFRDSCTSAEDLRELLAGSLHISDREIWRTARRLKLKFAAWLVLCFLHSSFNAFSEGRFL